MYTVGKEITSELIINKSRFITKIYKCMTENDAKKIIKNIKKEYKDSTHVCYGYIIDNIKRYSDDKEPSGTAGIPILNVLEKNNLNYVIALVIRYFGGIKLGSGGLTRAYSNSISSSLQNLILIEKGYRVTIEFDYKELKEIDNLLKGYCIEKKFNDLITYTFNINMEDINIINKYNIIKKEPIIL